MKILYTENLKKKYGTKDSEFKVLKGISLSVNKGEFVCIIGASGSGKSTLLNMIGGIDIPTSGKVYIENQDIFSLNDDKISEIRRNKIGFIFQQYNLIPALTVYENIQLPVLIDDKKVDKDYIDEIINLLDLSDKKNSFPSQLSGGQQQRVSIARALANKPSIILADEPTGNLDKKNGEDVISLLKATIKKFNVTLILVTHDMNVASCTDRIITIEDGAIISDEVTRNE